MNMREYMNLLEDIYCEPQAGDNIDIIAGDTLIETYIEDVTDDGVIIRLDETAIDLLLGAKKQISEAEYHGRKVTLGKPFLTPDGPKKRAVYVRKPNGNIVKVGFGDKKMRIKKTNPKRRKSFRARHHCENPGPRWKARYWSCKYW